MKKAWIAGISVVLMLSIFFGCIRSSQPMSSREFCSAMKEKGYTVTRETEPTAIQDCQKLVIATNDQNISCHYYCMKNADSAQKVYDSRVDHLREQYGGSKVVSSEMKTSQSGRYTVEAAGQYCTVLRRENTVLCVEADPEYSGEVKAVVQQVASGS